MHEWMNEPSLDVTALRETAVYNDMTMALPMPRAMTPVVAIDTDGDEEEDEMDNADGRSHAQPRRRKRMMHPLSRRSKKERRKGPWDVRVAARWLRHGHISRREKHHAQAHTKVRKSSSNSAAQYASHFLKWRTRQRKHMVQL